MTWRFRKSVKLFPGVRLNLTNRGISTTVGVRGLASVNIGTRGTHLNLGVPGTGLSSRTKFGGSMPGTRQPVNPSNQIPELQSGFPSLEETGVIKSAAAEELTSEGLVSLKETLREAFQEYADISRERATAWAELQPARHRRE